MNEKAQQFIAAVRQAGDDFKGHSLPDNEARLLGLGAKFSTAIKNSLALVILRPAFKVFLKPEPLTPIEQTKAERVLRGDNNFKTAIATSGARLFFDLRREIERGVAETHRKTFLTRGGNLARAMNQLPGITATLELSEGEKKQATEIRGAEGLTVEQGISLFVDGLPARIYGAVIAELRRQPNARDLHENAGKIIEGAVDAAVRNVARFAERLYYAAYILAGEQISRHEAPDLEAATG